MQRPPAPGLWAYPTLPGEGPATSAPSVSQPSYPSYSYGSSGAPPAYPPWGGYPQAGAQQPPQQPPPMPPGQANGLGPSALTSSPSMGPESVTLIRLRLDEDFRIDPPIPISAALLSGTATPRPAGSSSDLQTQGSGSRTPPVPPLDREQALVAETQPVNRVAQFFTTAEASVFQPTNVAQFVDMGFKAPHAALGVAYAQQCKLSDADVPDFAGNLGELTGMGYPPSIAAGALVIKKNDLRAASELCLTLPPR